MKVVAASNEESLNIIADIYAMVVEANPIKWQKLQRCENTQRDFKIGLMNGLSVLR